MSTIRSVSKVNEVLLKSALLADGSVVDIRISGEKISEIGTDLTSEGISLDCTGLRVLPGFVDLHTHLREPG